jgi:hypothetical protein
MPENDEKSNYQFIGGALGFSDSNLSAMKQIYSAAKEILDKYIEIGTDIPGGVGNIIKIAGGISKLLGSSEPNQFDILYGQIKVLVAQVQANIDHLSLQVESLALSDIESKVDGIKTTAAAYAQALSDNKPGVATSPQAYAFGVALNDSATCVQNMYHPAYWRRTFDPDLVCKVGASQAMRFAPPQDAPGMAWDYRAALPILVKVVQTRVLCLKLANAPLTKDALKEIDEMADFITQVHNKIQSGFVLTEVPGVASAGNIHGGDWQHSVLAIGFWEQLGKPCGAIDTYAGYGAIKPFPLPQLSPSAADPNPNSVVVQGRYDDPDYNQGANRSDFNLLYLAKALRARAELDAVAGLPGLRDYVVTLRSVTLNLNAKQALPKPLPFGPRQIAQPSMFLLMQMARPMAEIGASNQKYMPFLAGWPTALPALAAHFAQVYKTGRPTSLGSLVTGD